MSNQQLAGNRRESEMRQKRRGFNQGSDLTNVYLETSQRQILQKRLESDWV